MEMVIVSLFLGFLAAELLVESLLNEANMRHLERQWREGRLPDAFAAHISPETHEKSVRYALARGRFGRWSAVYGAGLTLLVLFGGVLPWVDGLARGAGAFLPVPEAAGILFCLAVGGVFAVMSLPLRVYATFVLEERFGFNKTDARTFLMDRLKGTVLAVVIGAPFLYGVLWLMQATGAWWWVYVFGFVFAFQGLMLVVYPTLIAPLFNRFSPVADDSLKDAIAELAQRVGLRTSGIYTMDGSKRSGHSNAYFTGLGKAKRIVLFDTLLEQLDRPQLLSVLAHEMGHYKMRHVLKGLALSAVFTLAGLWVLSLLLDYPPLFRAFGLAEPAHHTALVIFSLISGPFTFWLAPFMNRISRRHEYEADGFAVRLLEDGKPLEEALLALTVNNLSNPTPHPWYSAYHDSHPATAERIHAIRIAGAGVGAAAAAAPGAGAGA